MFDFNGKVLWLTGANGAISRAIAKTFFGLGASCMLTDLDEAGVIGFAKSLDPSGKRAVGLKQDASRSEDAASAAEAIKTRFGKLDYLVTSAGLYPEQMINDMTDAQWRQALGVNLDGVFFTCRASIPLFAEGGAVGQYCVDGGSQRQLHACPLCRLKGGRPYLFSRLARWTGAEETKVIRCRLASIIDMPTRPAVARKAGTRLIAETPLKRLGRPEEVADTVAYLCSDWQASSPPKRVPILTAVFTSRANPHYAADGCLLQSARRRCMDIDRGAGALARGTELIFDLTHRN